MAELTKMVPARTIYIVALGSRKIMGPHFFEPHADYEGEVTEMEYEEGMSLVRAEETKPAKDRLFAVAKEKKINPVGRPKKETDK